MRPSRRDFLRLAPAAMLAASARGVTTPRADRETRNVILVTTDGLRWQEVFRGAEESLLSKAPGGVADVEGLKRAFWRDRPEQRRAALLPFFWDVLARHGQLYGNADAGSAAKVTNGKNFSYPGYNELLTGAADPRIDSNDKKPNPNVNVLEWLNAKPAYRGRVAAFGAWDVFPYILHEERSGVPVTAGWEPISGDDLSDRQRLLNDLIASTHRLWGETEIYDSLMFEAALEHLKRRKPRVLYIAFGETDEFAHEGRYDHYLNSAHRFDASLRRLWDTLQAMPEYAGQTSLVVSTDHGRGDPPDGWKSHGARIPGAENIWIGVLGPDTPALGMRRDCSPVTQSQVAATVAALLGEDFREGRPEAAAPIADAIRP
jgi:hypothetical protein